MSRALLSLLRYPKIKMSKLKVYYDLMSQVSRGVYMFMKLNKIPFEDKPVALRSGNMLLYYLMYCSLQT